MKLSSMFKRAAQTIRTAVRQAEAQAREQARGQPHHALTRHQTDGFDGLRRATPVDLGRIAPASAAADETYVRGLYRELLGREPDAEGLRSHLRGLATGMSRGEIRQVFLTSPEYREKQAAAAAAAATPAIATAERKRVAVGPVPLEGYDSTKLHTLDHQTVKYQFGRVASNYPLDSVKDKASAEALLRRMVPDLEKAGLTIHDVQGDKIRVETELGHEWVDVVRGAGSGHPGWWWGSEGKAIPGTEPRRGPGPTGPTQPTGPTPTEPGAALATVPMRPEYANAPIDRSSPSAAARSAAQWVKDTYPHLFGIDDRQVAYEVMTHVIGALRAAGIDAHRVVNHPSRAVGDGWRYGSDAVVLNGRVFDVYGSFGEPGKSHVQALDVGAYEAGRLRE